MKEKLTNNIGLKLLSLFLAFVLWAGVINSQDPVETMTFEDVPVKIINEDSLTAKDKIPEVIEGDTITVVVEARRSVCDKLTKNDIVAVADFEKISLTDAVPIEVSVNGYTEREVEIVRGLNQVMKLSLEDTVSKDFRVKIATSGDPTMGYVTGDMVASPNVITLTGSNTQISNIKEVVFVVDITGISTERQVIGVPVIYDMNGEVVSNSKVTMSSTTVKVNIPVLKTKRVAVEVKTTGTPAEGYEVTGISYQPDVVTVAGTEAELFLLGNKITAYCDITGADDVVEANFDIAALWNDSLSSLRLVDEEELAVTVTLKPYEEKVFELEPSSLEIRNLPTGFRAEIIKFSQNQVRVRGNQTKLKETTLEKMSPYIDLLGYSKNGIYVVAVCFDDLSGLLLQDMITIEVRVFALEAGESGVVVISEEEAGTDQGNTQD